jgi:EAL domain-containing protein (putative c-di-GMP-specific phosphodiesterase class I)
VQFRHSAFVAEIKEVVSVDTNAAAGLELELTEGVIMQDVGHSIDCLELIRDLGVQIAIDDFGTGFSSLSYRSILPLDTLKIDRSFVVRMTTPSAGLGLVSTLISLAHDLKLTIVVEGVETEEQARLLRVLTCDDMQGFLFSKPLPSESLEARFLAAPSVDRRHR